MQPLYYVYQDGIEKGPFTSKGIRALDLRPGTIISTSLDRQKRFPYTEEKIDFNDPEEDNRLYFLAKRGISSASLTIAQLQENREQLCEAEFIWTEGMEQWKELESFPELKALLKPSEKIPPIPHKRPAALPPLPHYNNGGYSSDTSYRAHYAQGTPSGATTKSLWEYFWQCISKKYVDFNGRAGRKEYWSFFLFSNVVGAAASMINGTGFLWRITDSAFYSFDEISVFSSLPILISLALLLPSIAVGVRRLHDTNRSGWWMLIGLIPIVGVIILLIYFIQEGTIGPNQYGEDTQRRQ